jgi:hypothetical protein
MATKDIRYTRGSGGRFTGSTGGSSKPAAPSAAGAVRAAAARVRVRETEAKLKAAQTAGNTGRTERLKRALAVHLKDAQRTKRNDLDRIENARGRIAQKTEKVDSLRESRGAIVKKFRAAIKQQVRAESKGNAAKAAEFQAKSAGLASKLSSIQDRVRRAIRSRQALRRDETRVAGRATLVSKLQSAAERASDARRQHATFVREYADAPKAAARFERIVKAKERYLARLQARSR